MANSTPNNSIHCDRCCHNVTGLSVDSTCPSCGLEQVVRTALPVSVMYKPWLHRAACLLVFMTFVLVTSGGNVTSQDAGLAVPDGFWVFGYFLWTFPYELWQGGIWHEHVHRLLGSAIGCMCILMLWMVFTNQSHRPRLKKLAIIVLIAVILQGVLGALRVDIEKFYPATAVYYRVAHAITGQLFLCLTVLLAVATSRYWITRSGVCKKHLAENTPLANTAKSYQFAAKLLFIVLLIQLSLGAITRHTRANDTGLSIPDFPMSYDMWIPPFSQEGIEDAMLAYHQKRDTADAEDYGVMENDPFTPLQVGSHYAHRVWAAIVLAACLYATIKLLSLIFRAPDDDRLSKLKLPAASLLFMVFVQLALGMFTIWTERKPDVATAHQALGALMLATSFLLWLRVNLTQDFIYDMLAKNQKAITSKPSTNVALEGAGV